MRRVPTILLASAIGLYGCSSAPEERAPAPMVTLDTEGPSSLPDTAPSPDTPHYRIGSLIYVFTRAGGKLALNGCMKGEHDGHKTLTTFGVDYIPPSIIGGAILTEGIVKGQQVPNIRPSALSEQAMSNPRQLVTGIHTFGDKEVDCGPVLDPTHLPPLTDVGTGITEQWNTLREGTVIEASGNDGYHTLPAN